MVKMPLSRENKYKGAEMEACWARQVPMAEARGRWEEQEMCREWKHTRVEGGVQSLVGNKKDFGFLQDRSVTGKF